MRLFTHILLCVALAAGGGAMQAGAFELPDSLVRYSAEAVQTVSTGNNTPFWLVNNRFGVSSRQKNNGYVRAGLFVDAQRRNDKRVSWGAGADLVGAWNFDASFIVQQLYADMRYRALEVSLGSKERSSGFENPRLSSGNLLFSTNARPIPQLRVALPDYVDVPWTNRWLAVKGYLSYGCFTDDDWQLTFTGPDRKHTKHVLFHSKGGYLRIGRTDRFPLVLEGGLEMGAQFGGKSIRGSQVIDMPNGIKDWLKVLIPSGGDSSTPMGEQLNVYGNHTGAWNFRLSYLPQSADWGASVYLDHYFEDHSMLFMEYRWRDMLLGVEFKLPQNPVVSTFVYEYLNTRDQASSVYWDHTDLIPEQVSGRDQYYNHVIYTGWQHWGYGIGNPLLISPLYNADHSLYFYHNRIKGHHFGLEGRPSACVGWRLLLSYTRSWGTYDTPTRRVMRNFNTLAEVTYSPRRLAGWSATLSVATDGGALLGPSFGTMLSIKKTGWL